jgi:hypothetical protein
MVRRIGRHFGICVTTLVLVATGFSGGADARSHLGANAYPYRPSAARIPACAGSVHARALSASFPRSFPFPPHSAVTRNQTIGGSLKVTAFSPFPTLAAGKQFFYRQLPKAGFQLGMSDAEPNVEVEADFAGNKVSGHWRLRRVSGCHGAFLLVVLIHP